MQEDSITRGESKLIRDKNGFPVFENTSADLRYVDKAISREDADKATIACFMNCVERDRKMAWQIIDQQLNPKDYVYTEERVVATKVKKK